LDEFDLTRSNRLLAKSQAVIPGGNTFGKTDLFKEGKTPYMVQDASGAEIRDVDGNRYIDFIMGLGQILLGYRYPKVDAAIRMQLESGITFSLIHPLELEVAEMLIEMIPSAEMVRFGKNGSDATTAAVRLSRYITGKDHVLFCGYHGWQDWYVSRTSRPGGIPESTRKLSHRFEYNNIDSLLLLIREYKDDVACVIIDPINRWIPEDGFLAKIREITEKNKILLIFDEIVTGFRFHRGGVQSLYGVVPDLSCFGKALSNGMPLSALVGKEIYMRRFDDLFYTLTSAGETLSLAAAKAALTCYRTEDVPAYLAFLGNKLLDGLNHLVTGHGLTDEIEIQGTPQRPILHLKESQIFTAERFEERAMEKVLFLIGEMCRHGVLFNMSNFISYTHDQESIQAAIDAFDRVFQRYADAFMM
jgi:glutamate-1-semialdehyde 2,1-aminomutase